MKALQKTIEGMVNNSQYNEACKLIAKEMNLGFKTEFLKNDFHFEGDKDKRDIYKITLKREGRKYTFNFGQSINKSQYYQDKNIKERTYTLNGGNRTGGYKVHDLSFLDTYCDLIKGVEPTLYDVLACLQKYDVGTFEDFCDCFGYDIDSRSAKKTYKAVVKEYDKMCTLFSESELEILREIQ